jgi:hypothetical protein
MNQQNTTWRLEAVSKEGVVVRRPSKYSLILSEEKADRMRNSYQAFWDKFFPDLGLHVRVVQNPMVPLNKRYHVYDQLGAFRATLPWEEAINLVNQIDGSLVETI